MSDTGIRHLSAIGRAELGAATLAALAMEGV